MVNTRAAAERQCQLLHSAADRCTSEAARGARTVQGVSSMAMSRVLVPCAMNLNSSSSVPTT